ncbi:MAG: Dam family site-specific DNA-(adenine-N6)-methyltransferase, partial [Clostridium sp.]|uniref:Dam family site-specific DNA-(adenine-N6)-methyltransferase n=1 Tax=Clostridium sp. TaxID=1506 RepID=UPI003F416AD1
KEYKNKVDIFREDANNLVKNISADLVYIDPPYNSRQYCDMYHLLENLAEWKKPNVYYKAKKMDRKHLKSKYSQKEATEAFRALITSINAKYIVVSYNDTGNKGTERSKAKITDDDMIRILSEKGILKIEQKEYTVFNTGQSQIEGLQERFFVCEVFRDEKKEKKLKLEKSSLKSRKYVKPPTNYTGSKYKQLEQMFKFLPDNIEEKNVIDLFAGGGSIGINITGKKVICNDKQKSLVRLYNLFKRESIDTIMANIRSLIDRYELSNVNLNGYNYYGCDSSSGVGKYNKNKYEEVRRKYNELKDSSEKDYLFFILIIYGFNNQIRFNSKGEFNMPVGKRDFNKNVKNNLKETVLKIQSKNIEFISNDFRKVDININDDNFVYCDPPYILTNATYNENGGWTETDERELLELLSDLSSKGVSFMLSNVLEHSGKKHTVLLEWALEHKFNIIHINKDYKNSSYQKKDKNSKSDEVIITNYI